MDGIFLEYIIIKDNNIRVYVTCFNFFRWLLEGAQYYLHTPYHPHNVTNGVIKSQSII
jgi:hypothetical protein